MKEGRFNKRQPLPTKYNPSSPPFPPPEIKERVKTPCHTSLYFFYVNKRSSKLVKIGNKQTNW